MLPAKHLFKLKDETVLKKSIVSSGGTFVLLYPFLGVIQLKKKVNKDEVISLYINGYIANEIASNLSYNVTTVRKAIKKYKDEIGYANTRKIKEIHSEARRNRFGEVMSFNKRQKRKHMSTRVAVNKNQSGYKLNKNKSALVYKREVGAKPCDLPSVYR